MYNADTRNHMLYLSAERKEKGKMKWGEKALLGITAANLK